MKYGMKLRHNKQYSGSTVQYVAAVLVAVQVLQAVMC